MAGIGGFGFDSRRRLRGSEAVSQYTLGAPSDGDCPHRRQFVGGSVPRASGPVASFVGRHATLRITAWSPLRLQGALRGPGPRWSCTGRFRPDLRVGSTHHSPDTDSSVDRGSGADCPQGGGWGNVWVILPHTGPLPLLKSTRLGLAEPLGGSISLLRRALRGDGAPDMRSNGHLSCCLDGSPGPAMGWDGRWTPAHDPGDGSSYKPGLVLAHWFVACDLLSLGRLFTDKANGGKGGLRRVERGSDGDCSLSTSPPSPSPPLAIDVGGTGAGQRLRRPLPATSVIGACEYRSSVIPTLECPRRSLTISSTTPIHWKLQGKYR